MTYPYVAGAVLLASDLNTDFAAKTDTAMTQNAQTGTSYSFALADASKLLTMSNAAANTVTVTKQATVTWITGTQLRVINLGAGTTTLVADTGVTINGNAALKQYQGGTLIRTASDVWLFVPTASSSGMDLITPTSVAGSGVTLSGGAVSFSASTTISVNGCFTSTYDNYLMYLNVPSASGNCDLGFRLRLSGTDASGANYSYAYVNVATGLAGLRTQNATSGVLGGYGSTIGHATVTVQMPALASRTGMRAIGNAGTGTPYSFYDFGATHDVATAYDGISILPTGGVNITGTLRIYGLRNS